MSPVIVMLVFILHGKAIGAQMVGSTETVLGCQIAAAKIIEEKAGDEPKGSTPFPLCIDTRPMITTLAKGPEKST